MFGNNSVIGLRYQRNSTDRRTWWGQTAIFGCERVPSPWLQMQRIDRK